MKKETLSIIDRYVSLKTEEKGIQNQLSDLKCLFYKAADSFGSDQIVSGEALIYKIARPVYEYPEAIQKAEKKLKAMKKAFEEKYAPVSINTSWGVKV